MIIIWRNTGYISKRSPPYGDWCARLRPEIMRLDGLERQYGNWDWPLAYVYALLDVLYFKLCSKHQATDLTCIEWYCMVGKKD